MAMSDAGTVINSNANLREMVRETGSRGVITIPDFLTSRYVTRNQLGQNYCSNLTILLPGHEEVTPINMKGFFPVPLDEKGRPVANYDPGNAFYQYGGLPIVHGRPGENLNLQYETEHHIPAGGFYTIPPGATVLVKEEEDDSEEPEEEKSLWQKVKSWTSDTATTIWNGAKEVTVWAWDNVAVPAGKYAICCAADYYLGPGAGVVTGAVINCIEGQQSPQLIGVDTVPEDHLLEYHPENREQLRDIPSGPIYMIDPTDFTITNISKEYFKRYNNRR